MESYWLCTDCLQAAAYDDFCTLSLYHSSAELGPCFARMHPALRALLPLSADFDPESGIGIEDFSTQPCEACCSRLHGTRHRFTRL